MILFNQQDGLWLVTQEPEVIQGYQSATLTPNAMEFVRLYKKVVCEHFTLLYVHMELGYHV